MTIKEIKNNIVKVLSSVDEYLNSIEEEQGKRESEIDAKIKTFKLLEQQKIDFDKSVSEFENDKLLLQKEKENLREKQNMLEIKEKRLEEKIKRINEMANL